jgi:hypothetical protein
MFEISEKVYDNISLPNYQDAQMLPKFLDGLYIIIITNSYELYLFFVFK